MFWHHIPIHIGLWCLCLNLITGDSNLGPPPTRSDTSKLCNSKHNNYLISVGTLLTLYMEIINFVFISCSENNNLRVFNALLYLVHTTSLDRYLHWVHDAAYLQSTSRLQRLGSDSSATGESKYTTAVF